MIVPLKKLKDFCITLLLAVVHEECILNGSSWVQWVLKCVWKRCYCITYRHCDKAFSLSLHHSSALYSDIFFPFKPLRWLCRSFVVFFPKLIFSYSLKNKVSNPSVLCLIWVRILATCLGWALQTVNWLCLPILSYTNFRSLPLTQLVQIIRAPF